MVKSFESEKYLFLAPILWNLNYKLRFETIYLIQIVHQSNGKKLSIESNQESKQFLNSVWINDLSMLYYSILDDESI